MPEIIQHNRELPDWYYYDGSQAVGPLDQGTLEKLHKAEIIDIETQVRRSTEEWIPFGDVMAHQIKSRSAPHSTKLTKPPILRSLVQNEGINTKGFSISFGTSFIPSSADFRGDGRIEISHSKVECLGLKSIPLVVEWVARLLVFVIALSVAGSFSIHGIFWVFLLVIGNIVCASIIDLFAPEHRRVWEIAQIKDVHRTGSKLSFIAPRAGSSEGAKLSFRAADKEVAIEIENLLKS